ncbi:hypothetical protein SNEBB_009316 [Seison nebaliae]|nr:hypothetical protein SNEBB_009316 [Seison nebaliae]
MSTVPADKEKENEKKKQSKSLTGGFPMWTDDELDPNKRKPISAHLRYPVSASNIGSIDQSVPVGLEESGNMWREGFSEFLALGLIDFGTSVVPGYLSTQITKTALDMGQTAVDHEIKAEFYAYSKATAPSFQITFNGQFDTNNFNCRQIQGLFTNMAAGEAKDPTNAIMQHLHLNNIDASFLAKNFYAGTQRFLNSYLYEKWTCAMITITLAGAAGIKPSNFLTIPATMKVISQDDLLFPKVLSDSITNQVFVFFIEAKDPNPDLAILALASKGGRLMEFGSLWPRIAQINHQPIKILAVIARGEKVPVPDQQFDYPSDVMILSFMTETAVNRVERTSCLIGIESASQWCFQSLHPSRPLDSNGVYGYSKNDANASLNVTMADTNEVLNKTVQKIDMNVSFLGPTILRSGTSLTKPLTGRIAKAANKRKAKTNKKNKEIIENRNTKNNTTTTTTRVSAPPQPTIEDVHDPANLFMDFRNFQQTGVIDDNKQQRQPDDNDNEVDEKEKEKRKKEMNNDEVILITGSPFEMPKSSTSFEVPEYELWLTPFCETTDFNINRYAPKDYNPIFRLVPRIMETIPELILLNNEWDAFTKYSPLLIIRMLTFNGGLLAVAFGIFNLENNITGFDFNRAAQGLCDADGFQSTITFFNAAYIFLHQGTVTWGSNVMAHLMKTWMGWYPHILSLNNGPLYAGFPIETVTAYNTHWGGVFQYEIVTAIDLLFGAARLVSWPQCFGISGGNFRCDMAYGFFNLMGKQGWTSCNNSTAWAIRANDNSPWLSCRYEPETLIILNGICQQLDISRVGPSLKISFDLCVILHAALPWKELCTDTIELDEDNFNTVLQVIRPGYLRSYDWYTDIGIIPWISKSKNFDLWERIAALRTVESSIWLRVGLKMNAWFKSKEIQNANRTKYLIPKLRGSITSSCLPH